MKKIFDFLKNNFIVAKWTFWYFLVMWFILKYIFGFDMFSRIYWWKFFHARLHGFVGFVFGLLIYTMIPIYFATLSVVRRTKEPLIKIPVFDKVCNYTKNLVLKPTPIKVEEKPQEEKKPEEPAFEYPTDLPHEMRAQFKQAKEQAILSRDLKPEQYAAKAKVDIPEPQAESFPIPTDFDLGDNVIEEASVPTFKEINFDEPEKPVEANENSEFNNAMTKYLKENKIEFETYEDFIITQNHLIYVHNDPDFWVFDEESWFASGKQIDSPISIMLEMTKNENLVPVIYFETTNIMDFEGTVKKLTDQGITVITNPKDLK